MKRILLFNLFIFLTSITCLISQWKQADNGLIGNGNNIISIENYNGIYYALTEKGIYLSEDSCKTWSNISIDLNENFFNYGNQRYFFYKKNDTICLLSQNNGNHLAVSTNNGVNWNYSKFLGDGLCVVDSNIIIANYRGTFTSSDLGKSIIQTDTLKPSGNLNYNSIVNINQTVFLPEQNGGLFVSNNYGKSWKLNSFKDTIVRYLFVDNENLFVSTNQNLFISRDCGNTWDRIDSGLESGLEKTVIKENQILGYGKGLFFSVNYGQTWKHIEGPDHISVTSMLIDSNKFYVGTEEGMFVFYDEGDRFEYVHLFKNQYSELTYFTSLKKVGLDILIGTYAFGLFKYVGTGYQENRNIGLTHPDLTDMKLFGNSLYATTQFGLFVSNDDGENWKLSNFKDTIISNIISFKGNFYVSTSKGIFKSSDSSASWIKCGIDTLSADFIVNIDTLLFVATNYGIFSSTDEGESWLKKNNGISDQDNIDKFIICKNNIIAYYSLGSSPVYFSSDYGENWKIRDTIYYQELVTNTDNSILVGRIGSSIFISNDCGNSWNRIQIKASPFLMPQISVLDNVIYMFKADGLYISKDFGYSWSNISFKRDTSCSGSYIIKPYIFLLTMDNSYSFNLLRAKLDELTFTNMNEEIKLQDKLIITPNPASDYIEISVGAQGAVPDKVSIFDILGMEQFTLTPTLSLKGEGVRIDISSLPPGVYFVRIGDVVRKFVKM